MSIPRRRLLGVLGTVATVGSVTGCLSMGGTNGQSTGSTTATGTDTGAPTTTHTRTDTRTRNPGPDSRSPPARDIFDGVSCPSFTKTDRTVCWHTRDDDELAIRPSGQVFRPVSGNGAVETITFTLRNTLDAPILFNPHSWAIKRQTATGWEHVAPDGAYKPLHELDPGNTYQWVLSRQSHPTSHTTRTTHLTVPLENGRHAFVLTGSIADESPNTTRTAEGLAGTTTEWVTLFDVQRLYQ